MRICIVGCGAVGSVIAAHLARTGEVEVWVYDVWNEHIDAIQKHGLRLSGLEDFSVQVKASSTPGALPPCDFGIMATKADHSRTAIAQVAHIIQGESAICSVQNGIGNEETIAEHVRYVIRGVTFLAGHVAGPGHVVCEIKGGTWIGPYEPSGISMGTVSILASIMARAGMNTVALDDVRGMQWTKLIFNASTNAVGALTRLDHAAVTHCDPTYKLCNDIIAEAEVVAEKLGISLFADPRDFIRKEANAPRRHKTSMLQDVLAGRRTEVDFINGALVRLAERSGVPTPLNRALWQLIKGLEYSWTNPE